MEIRTIIAFFVAVVLHLGLGIWLAQSAPARQLNPSTDAFRTDVELVATTIEDPEPASNADVTNILAEDMESLPEAEQPPDHSPPEIGAMPDEPGSESLPLNRLDDTKNEEIDPNVVAAVESESASQPKSIETESEKKKLLDKKKEMEAEKSRKARIKAAEQEQARRKKVEAERKAANAKRHAAAQGTTENRSRSPAAPPRTGPTREAQAISRPEPAFPSALRRAGISGNVTVKFSIGANGQARATLAVSSGHRALDQAALAAAQRWRFRPALKNGQAVPSSQYKRFSFQSR